MAGLKSRLFNLIAVVCLLTAFSSPVAAELCFTANIDGAQAGTGSTATGVGWFLLNDAETELTYNVSLSGLVNETAAHIHSDVEASGVVHGLTTGSPKVGTWLPSSPIPMTPARVADLKAGDLYVNIHSVAEPAGEIRGQILLVECTTTCFDASIDGAQAGTGSIETGTGRFVLDHTQTRLTYNIDHTGFTSGETAAHIHSDVEAGGVVHGLALGSPKIGTWEHDSPIPMTPARVTDLMAGDLYVNLHSASFPAGEIRGQILAGSCTHTCFEAIIDGPTASTTSLGYGEGSFFLNHTETELDFEIAFTGLGSIETAAHIHSDAEAAAVVHGLALGSPKSGTWKWTSPIPMTAARVADLKSGMLYVNIHSVNEPAGAIRGYLTSIACVPTAADLPDRVTNRLRQNIPNPFNPTTTIRYELANTVRVTIRVYDVGGRLIRTLVDGVVGAGPQSVKWNGRTDNGQPSATGVYFYRLETGSYAETRKMILLK